MIDKDSGWVEAEVVINGYPLTFAESMTLRVAVSSFRMFVNNPESRAGLGLVADGYERALQNIESFLLKTK
jgi:hypothetical protein